MCVCVYCLANMICSFFFLFLHYLLLLFFYYISHSTDSSGMCIFFSVRVFLSGEPFIFEKKKNIKRKKSICFVFLFVIRCLWFFFAIIIYLFCFILVWCTEMLIKQNRFRLIFQLKTQEINYIFILF